MHSTDLFIIRSYGWQELAQLYCPGVTPGSASRRLKNWVLLHPELLTGLTRLGWKPTARLLTPMQVKAIVHYLGEP